MLQNISYIENLDRLQKIKDDLSLYARNFLVIKSKLEGLIKFNFNVIQTDFHKIIETRKKARKQAKFVVVKARQLGLSTYIEARLFHKVSFQRGKNAFILADKQDTANSIFQMAKRYYENLPEALRIPRTSNSRNELSFITDSLFRVGTAGSDVIGRSTTNNFFHGSEVAFWGNSEEIVSGILQTIPDSLDSEVFLESTTNGTTGKGLYFYEMALLGRDPKSEYQTIFYPWFKNPEYKKTLIEPIKFDDYEEFLVKTYNLTAEQIFWRRQKIENDFKKREHLFKQEYPSHLDEAFLKNDNSLIPSEKIEFAKKNMMSADYMPIVIGVDPARNGDRTIITIRQGRVLQKIYKYEQMTTTKLANCLLMLFQRINPQKIFIDYGHGIGTYDILVAHGLGPKIELVQFGESAYDKRKYANRRAEMFDKMRDWFMQEGGVYIREKENLDEFIRDISIIPDLKRYDSNGKYYLEKKEKIVKGSDINSTDFADSLALTFAAPVQTIQRNDGWGSELIKVVNKNWQQT